ncbi:sugar transferase [Variovorax sp. CCNWLW225]|jgi:exopolysaccharide production protein ExoY|uniref:sugar transferase n=1 Tax=Variovorax sp. CCNWLW225 TaxID=3127462 RepID=UPI0030783364
MTNFRSEELTAPSSEEMHSEFSDAAWERVNHPAMLRIAKRAVDIAASLFFFTAFGWLYVLLAIGVFLSSGAPVLYSQPRYGRGGRVFKFYKFRSMLPNSAQILEEHLKNDPVARQQWDDYQKLENDPRITRFGKFIRKTSLDELPQFWNVLVGDMSLVGPRPCMLDQKGLYGADWSFYCAVRPGITGLWQVSGRNQLSYKKRVALDVTYVETLSVGRDIGIFIRTIWVVAVGHGSR